MVVQQLTMLKLHEVVLQLLRLVLHLPGSLSRVLMKSQAVEVLKMEDAMELAGSCVCDGNSALFPIL